MTVPFHRSLVVAITAIGLVSLAACGGSSGSSKGSGGPSGSTVQLGAIETMSGPFAQIGTSKIAGAKVAIAELNKSGGADGHKLALTVKDEQASPNATVSDVRDLLGANIKLMFGGTTDSDCLAAAPLVSNAGGVMLGTSCQTNLLETSKFVPGFFEIAPTNYMLSMATAQLAASEFGDIKSWDGIGPDYEFGHEVWQSFQTDLKKLSPSVSFRKNVFVPLTETQFSSYITSLLSGLPSNSAQSSGLFLSTFSATTIGLAQQGKSYNLFGRYKVALNLGGSTPTAEALGANTPPLYFIYDYYNGAYNNATNTKFVSEYKAANHGSVPNAWAYEGYTAVLAYAAAIKKAHSTDPNKIRTALAGLTFDTPKGSLTFRAKDHLLQSPVTVWKVVGDASAPGGFKVTEAKAIPVDKVLPPVHVG
jgi:ABC-type branched-chain amino acid transport systems, periplasmic component